MKRPASNRRGKTYFAQRWAGHYRKLERELRNKLREARLAAGFCQKEAGKHLHQDQAFISKIESGIRGVEFLEVEILAKLYEKPLDFFAASRRAAPKPTRNQRWR